MIIVTGGTGLVGKALQKIHPEFIYIGSKDGDLRDLNETKHIFNKYKPTGIIHLACVVGGLYKNINSNYEMFMDNMMINSNIMTVCQENNIVEGIFVLSSCVFPDKVEYPIMDYMLHDGIPHKSNEGYSYAKRNLEIMCRLHNEKYNTRFKCVIPTNLYGPHDNFNIDDSHVIPNLIHKTMIAEKENRPLILRGTGKSLRQFLFVEDFARMLSLIYKNPPNTDLLICGPCEEISIKLLAEMIIYLYNFENGIEYDNRYSDGQLKKTVDCSKFNEIYSLFKYTPILTGLDKTIKWFKENYPNIRK